MRASHVIGKFLIGITLPTLFMAATVFASGTMRCGHKLMRRMRFVSAILEEIETLGYGYNPPNDD